MERAPTPLASYDVHTVGRGAHVVDPPRPARRGWLRRRAAWALVAAIVLGSLINRSPLWVFTLPLRAVGSFRADHTFLTMDGTEPVAWNNCKAIHYVVNPQTAPPDWQRLLDDALGEITTASGYVFVLDGTTTDRNFMGGRYENDPVLVMWGVRREVQGLGEGVAGRGGPITFPTTSGPRYASGHAIFDAAYFDELRRKGDEGEEREIVMHEFMHVLGLGHVGRADEVMGTSGRLVGGNHLGDGDIAGLKALRAVPCPGAG